MRIPTIAVCLVAILIAPSVPAIPPPGSGNDLPASVELRAVRQVAPLPMVGCKMPARLDDCPTVVLRNVSAKATRAYWFRVRIVCADPFNKAASTPPAGDGGPAVTGQDRRWPNESIIAPGAEGEAHVAGLNGYQLAFFRRERRL